MTPIELSKFLFWEADGTNLPSDLSILNENLPIDTESRGKLRSPDLPNLVSWIGHASCLLKLGGVFILTDPVFSNHCSMVQFDLSKKTKRFRDPGIPLEVIDMVDAVVISHNHYDHLDYNSVTEITRRFPDARWFVPLGLSRWFGKYVQPRNICELNWWEDKEVEFGNGTKVNFTCVPAQHWSMRNGFDRNHSLWAGWTLSTPDKSVYFAGDTGYNDRIFNQIGHHLGPFDLSLIPIGAYKPRKYLKCQHVDPTEAVKVHREVGSKLSLGIHWGTFQLGYEHYMAPKMDLLTALEEAGVDPATFVTFKHGQTEEF